MYHSPITLNYTDPIIESAEKSIDGYIVRAVQNVGIDIDKVELGKALQYDRDQYYKGYGDGYMDGLAKSKIIRCKDCEFYQDNNGGYPNSNCRWSTDETPDPDDYCSYAERITDDN